MTTESATYIDQLDPQRPRGSDSLSFADDHIRLVKNTISATFVGSANDRWNTPLTVGPRYLNNLSGNLGIGGYVSLTADQNIGGRKVFLEPVIADIQSESGSNVISWDGGTTFVGSGEGATLLVASEWNNVKAWTPAGLSPMLSVANVFPLIINTLYPVGSIVLQIGGTNPATRFPGTSWQQIARGRFLVGQGSGADNNTPPVNKSFGWRNNPGHYQVTLNHNQMPAHAHSVKAMDECWYNAGSSFTMGDGPYFDKTMWTAAAGGDTRFQNRPTVAHQNTPPGYGVAVWERVS